MSENKFNNVNTTKSLNDEIFFYAEPLSAEKLKQPLKDKKIYVKVVFYNKDKKEIYVDEPNNVKVRDIIKEDVEFFAKKNFEYNQDIIISHKFNIKDFLMSKGFREKKDIENQEGKFLEDVKYISCWIDANNDNEVSVEYDEEVVVEICQFELIADDLKQIFPNSEQRRREETAKAFNKYYCEFEINTLDRVAHFLGQIGAETGELVYLEEQYNYTVENIFDTHLKKSTINHPTEEGKRTYKYHALVDGYDVDLSSCPIEVQKDGAYGHNRVSNPIVINPNWTYKNFQNAGYSIKKEYLNSKNLFDYVYGCRMGNGAKSTQDGSTYLGVGFIHLTGKDQYKNIHNYWNKNYPNDKKNFLGEDIKLLTKDVDVAMKSAMIFWSKIKKLNSLTTSKEKVKEVTYKVNGGYNNLKGRENFTNKAYEVLKAKMEIK